MRRKPAGSMNHQRAVAARFSAAATTYDTHAEVQNEVAAKVAELVRKLWAPGRVLDVGCGTGALTRMLAGVLPGAFFVAVDPSPAMIAVAQAQLAGIGRVLWVVGNIDSVRQGKPFELVASNCSLHWITPLEMAFKGIRDVLLTGGHLVFSIMLSGTLAELRAARERAAPRKAVPAMLPSRVEVLDTLAGSGFEVLSESGETMKREFVSASDLLKRLHEQGVTGGHFANTGVPLTKRELGKLVSDYDLNYKNEKGGVSATYEVMYVTARGQ
jgi:malonyl-CoA O-methyltransferase